MEKVLNLLVCQLSGGQALKHDGKARGFFEFLGSINGIHKGIAGTTGP